MFIFSYNSFNWNRSDVFSILYLPKRNETKQNGMKWNEMAFGAIKMKKKK